MFEGKVLAERVKQQLSDTATQLQQQQSGKGGQYGHGGQYGNGGHYGHGGKSGGKWNYGNGGKWGGKDQNPYGGKGFKSGKKDEGTVKNFLL